MTMSEKISDANLKVLGQIIEDRFSSLEERIREQKLDFKEQLSKTDLGIEKLEMRVTQEIQKLDEVSQKISAKLESKSEDLTKLQVESQSVSRQWGAFVGLIGGLISSIIVAVIAKFFGE